MNTLKKESTYNPIVTEYHESSAFDTLAQQWNQLTALSFTNTPFLTWQWQKIWWSYGSKDRSLRIITVSDENGHLCGIAPLYSEEKNEAEKLMLLGSTDLCDYLDFIVVRGKEKHFYHTLLSYLVKTATKQTTLCLNSLKQHSPTLSFFKEIANHKGYVLDIEVEDTAPSLDLPGNFESYLKGLTKKDRHEIRRKMRRAEKEGAIAFKKIDQPSRVMDTMPHFLDLFCKSMDKKDEFLNSEREGFFLTMAEEFSKTGWLELFALLLDEKEIAYLLWFNYHDTFYLYNSAYDPDYSSMSPGIVVITHCLKDAINRGIKRVDFLRGNEAYKYHFGAKDHTLNTLTLRLPGEKNLCIE